MKQQVFYIHGGNGYSEYEAFLNDLRTTPIDPLKEQSKKWSSYIRESLGEEYQVFAPTMPNKQNAKYEEWKIWFERHFEFLHDGAVLLGWSQGGYFLTKYLSENSTPFQIKALFLLAAPFEPDDFGGEDGGDFKPDPEKVPLIKNKVGKIVIMHSKDDFVVPYEHTLKYKEALPEAELVTFEDKNHFLVEELPELVEMINEVSES